MLSTVFNTEQPETDGEMRCRLADLLGGKRKFFLQHRRKSAVTMPSPGGAFPGCGRAIVGSRAKGHRYPGMMVFVGSCVDLGSPGRAIPASGKARGRSASGTVRSAPAQQIQSGPNFAPARRAIVTWFVPAAAVQRPTMKFVATNTADHLSFHPLHRARERLHT